MPQQSEIQDSGREPQTPTQRLASVLIGRDVREFVTERRRAGRPWRFIARDLYDATDGQIDVTHETIRHWYDEDAAA